MKTFLRLLAAGMVLAGATQMARAVPQLRISDGLTTITISDGGAGDSQAVPGQVVWVGSVGNWTLNVHTGTTYPVLGSLTNPVLDLSFNAISNANGGTLTVSFSADGFGPTAGNAVASTGGTTQGTVLYNTYGGTNNTLFSTSNLLTSQGPFVAPAFSGTTSGGNVNNVGPYSLTQVITITHAAGVSRITTGDSILTVPESGTSILLLGTGLTLLGLVARFRAKLA